MGVQAILGCASHCWMGHAQHRRPQLEPGVRCAAVCMWYEDDEGGACEATYCSGSVLDDWAECFLPSAGPGECPQGAPSAVFLPHVQVSCTVVSEASLKRMHTSLITMWRRPYSRMIVQRRSPCVSLYKHALRQQIEARRAPRNVKRAAETRAGCVALQVSDGSTACGLAGTTLDAATLHTLTACSEAHEAALTEDDAAACVAAISAVFASTGCEGCMQELGLRAAREASCAALSPAECMTGAVLAEPPCGAHMDGYEELLFDAADAPAPAAALGPMAGDAGSSADLHHGSASADGFEPDTGSVGPASAAAAAEAPGGQGMAGAQGTASAPAPGFTLPPGFSRRAKPSLLVRAFRWRCALLPLETFACALASSCAAPPHPSRRLTPGRIDS